MLGQVGRGGSVCGSEPDDGQQEKQVGQVIGLDQKKNNMQGWLVAVSFQLIVKSPYK